MIDDQCFIQHGRDLRLDFLRGLVMMVVICVHLEFLSLLSMFMWERLGMVSSAEGFVSLSGVVLGIVYKKRLLKEGFKQAALKLLGRAGQLYLVNIVMILSVLLISYLPWINSFQITHWVSVSGGAAFLLYPVEGTPWWLILKQALLLEIGPHQFRVIGLYSVLIAFAPLVLYFLYKKQTLLLLAMSWGIYLLNIVLDYRITDAAFEYAFPILTWQVLFFNGMIIGFHHEQVFAVITASHNRPWIYLAALCAFLFMLFALFNPNPFFWPWSGWHFFDSVTYDAIRKAWFRKETLGFGRVVNNLFFYTCLFVFIHVHWQRCYRWLGWLLIPIGQASLYVFIWHIYLILFWSNTPLGSYHSFWLNTIAHLASIGLIWLMVKKKFLYGLVPR